MIESLQCIEKTVFPNSHSLDIIELISQEAVMEQILIRNLPEGTKAILRKRAAEHDSSIEAEARAILTSGLSADKPTLVDLISMDGDTDVDFEPQRLGLQARTPEL